jgi:DNA primase
VAVDTELVRRQHPLADVVAAYGIELWRSGSVLVGRCPFHADRGRPNLTVYPQRWICYRCAEHGDVITFVEQMEHVGFRAAVARLGEIQSVPGRHHRRLHPASAAPRSRRLGPEELEALSAAVELYANRLLADERALGYMAGRGFRPADLQRCRVGFAAGNELAAYLRWRRLPLPPAVRVGLLDRDGRELLRDRIVVPELRRGWPRWLIGRRIDTPKRAANRSPTYLGLPGRKPLLGWEDAMAAGSSQVTVVEGPMDWLTLRGWGVPALALSGCWAPPSAMLALQRFARVYVALDADDPGEAGSQRLIQALGQRAVRVRLPVGWKDAAELASRSDGATVFAAALQTAENATSASA